MSEQASNPPAAPGPAGPGARLSPAGPAGPASTDNTGGTKAPPGTALVPRQASKSGRRVRRRVPVRGDSDHNFDAVQEQLKTVIAAMHAANAHLEGVDRRKRATATEASNCATATADAQLDPVFVQMTQEVATAEAEAAKAVRLMLRSAQQVEKSAALVKRAHARLYSPLHRVRQGRTYRTPKPGFFQR